MVALDLHQFIGLAGIPVIMALVQFIKGLRPTADARVWPAATFAVGLAINVGLAAYFQTDLVVGAALGILTALSASGLYSHATTLSNPPPVDVPPVLPPRG